MDELRGRIAADRDLIGRGERPLYHVTTRFDGVAIDVRILELPIVHLFVPDETFALEGGRDLIARTLGVDRSAFDVGRAPSS